MSSVRECEASKGSQKANPPTSAFQALAVGRKATLDSWKHLAVLHISILHWFLTTFISSNLLCNRNSVENPERMQPSIPLALGQAEWKLEGVDNLHASRRSSEATVRSLAFEPHLQQ